MNTIEHWNNDSNSDYNDNDNTTGDNNIIICLICDEIPLVLLNVTGIILNYVSRGRYDH